MVVERSQVPPLYALTPNLPFTDLRKCVGRLVAGGARWIQIREKSTSDAALARDVSAIIGEIGSRATIFVNDRADLAIGTGAAGVHLGDHDLPPEVVDKVRGAGELIIGVSTHSVEEAVRMAALEAVDYVAVGPIFSSPTKMVCDALGLAALTQTRERIEKPIVAIGGIDRTNIAEVLMAGADSAAVISALYELDRIEDNVRELIDRAELC